MKVYSLKECLEFKERSFRGDYMIFGTFSKYGCGIPLMCALDDSYNYNLCLLYNYTNIFPKASYKDLAIFKKIFEKETEFFQKYL